jgi:hypothetical protein
MPREHAPIEVRLPRGGFARAQAVAAVQAAGLPELIQQLAPSPLGPTVIGAGVLHGLADALDLGLAARAHLDGAIRAERAGSGFDLPELGAAQKRLLAAFQIVTTADAAVRHLGAHCSAPAVEGALELDGVEELLAEADAAALADRLVRLAKRFLEVKATRLDPERDDPAAFAGTTIAALLVLLRRAVELFAKVGELRPLVASLAARRVTVAGIPYSGLTEQAPVEAPAGLLPIEPDDIVGNDDYLAAGLRLARDVAGFDFDAGKNPKKLNPVLFGLGGPGCGKTVTAHAVGNYFLRYCRERGVPARFVVVRRTDWASSYQNASAGNLLRIFREEVHGFAGVCGVYWPDIDTALASRASNDLRMEEKQNLGAVFGLFDGTLIPKDGKWFLICDANTLHMDEAAQSRIAQNPFTVAGPTTVEHYVAMMRRLLREVDAFVPQDPAVWQRLGETAVREKLSGRVIESIATNVRVYIQDFEYPERYFTASTEDRKKIIAELSRPVDEAFLTKAVGDWVAFKAAAARREEEERFETEVKAVVRQLNAGRAAMERASATLGQA